MDSKDNKVGRAKKVGADGKKTARQRKTKTAEKSPVGNAPLPPKDPMLLESLMKLEEAKEKIQEAMKKARASIKQLKKSQEELKRTQEGLEKALRPASLEIKSLNEEIRKHRKLYFRGN